MYYRWYANDNKLSHEDPEVIDKILEVFKTILGNLKITRGKKHKHLGMTLSITNYRILEIETKDQIK